MQSLTIKMHWFVAWRFAIQPIADRIIVPCYSGFRNVRRTTVGIDLLSTTNVRSLVADSLLSKWFAAAQETYFLWGPIATMPQTSNT